MNKYTVRKIKNEALQVEAESRVPVGQECGSFIGWVGERTTANQRAADAAMEAWLASDIVTYGVNPHKTVFANLHFGFI